MSDSGTAIFDRILQLAALLAVMFVLHAGFARAEMLPETEHAAIAEALAAGLSPSLVLAVAAERRERGEAVTRACIRHDVATLKSAFAQYPGHLDLALARYAEGRGIVSTDRYVAAVRSRIRRLDADARSAARTIAAPMIAQRATLDDFDAAIGSKVRRAARRLDDFPLAPRRG